MKIRSQNRRGLFDLQTWLFILLALLVIDLNNSRAGTPDPLLAAGEQALIGSYKLDHVLLAPSRLVVFTNENPLFEGTGETPEQAARKGWLNAAQVAVLLRQDCAMTILNDHHIVITNLPSTDVLKVLSVSATWTIAVYHVFDTYGYRISLNCPGYPGTELHAKFFNADKPNPPILEIFYGDGKNVSLMFRFTKTHE